MAVYYIEFYFLRRREEEGGKRREEGGKRRGEGGESIEQRAKCLK